MSSWAAIRGLFSNGISVDKVSDTRAIEQISGIVNATDESVMRRVQEGDTQAIGAETEAKIARV